MFFRQIMDAFLVRTEPDSSMVKPAHIHITKAPHTKERERVEDENRLLVNPRRIGDGRAGQEYDGGSYARFCQDGGRATTRQYTPQHRHGYPSCEGVYWTTSSLSASSYIQTTT